MFQDFDGFRKEVPRVRSGCSETIALIFIGLLTVVGGTRLQDMSVLCGLMCQNEYQVDQNETFAL